MAGGAGPTLKLMDLNTTAGALRHALTTASQATPSRPALAAYGGCLLLLKQNRLSVVGADGELTIATKLDVDGKTDGQALVPPRPLQSFLATVAADAAVHVVADSGAVEVTATGLAPYRFRTLQATFPMPAANRAKPVGVNFELLGRAVAAVRAAVSSEHGGVEIVSDDSSLSLRATDNYRLHAATIGGAGFGTFTGVIGFDVLDRLAKHNIDGVSIDGKGRSVRFSGDDVVVSARLLGVPFPPVGSYLEIEQPTKIVLNIAEFRAKLTRLATVGDTAPILCQAAGKTMTLGVTNPELGSGSETIELDQAVGDEVEFYADHGYLSEAFAAHETNTVQLSYAQSLQPVVLRSNVEGGVAVTTLIQPVRA